MTERKSRSPAAKKGKLEYITPDQTKGAVNSLRKKGATFFKFGHFQEKTGGLPPHTPIAKIIKGLRGKK